MGTVWPSGWLAPASPSARPRCSAVAERLRDRKIADRLHGSVRTIDELMGHEASTRGAQHLGSAMGAHFRFALAAPSRAEPRFSVYSWMIDRMLPAGSRNQATGRTSGVRWMPLASVLVPVS